MLAAVIDLQYMFKAIIFYTLTWQTGTSGGSLAVTSETHFLGTLNGQKSITIPPILFCLTKSGNTSFASPRSKWKCIFKDSHS